MEGSLSDCTSSQSYERMINELCSVHHAELKDITEHTYVQKIIKFRQGSKEQEDYWSWKDLFRERLSPARKQYYSCKNFLLNYHLAKEWSEIEGHNLIMENYQFDCFKLLHDLHSKPAAQLCVAQQVLRCFSRVIGIIWQREPGEPQQPQYLHFNLTSFKAICLNDGYIIKFDWTDPAAVFFDKPSLQEQTPIKKLSKEEYIDSELRHLIKKGILRALKAKPEEQISSEKESFQKEASPAPIIIKSAVKISPSKQLTQSGKSTSGEIQDSNSIARLEQFISALSQAIKNTKLTLATINQLVGREQRISLPSIYQHVKLKRIVSVRQNSTRTFDNGPNG